MKMDQEGRKWWLIAMFYPGSRDSRWDPDKKHRFQEWDWLKSHQESVQEDVRQDPQQHDHGESWAPNSNTSLKQKPSGKPDCWDQCHQSHVSVPSQGVSHPCIHCCVVHTGISKEVGVTSGGPCSPRKLALPLPYGYPFENDTPNPCRMNHIWRVNESK